MHLKQSLEKSKEETKKEDKKPNKAIKVIFLLLSVVCIFSTLKQCSKSTTTFAFPVTGNYLLSTPCVTVEQVKSNGTFYKNVTIPTFYLSFNEDENGFPTIGRFYYIGGNSGNLGYNSVDISSGASSISSLPLLVGDSTTPNNLLWSQIPIEVTITSQSLLPVNFLSHIVTARQSFHSNINGYGKNLLIYDYISFNGDILLTLTLDTANNDNGSIDGFYFPTYYNDDLDRPLEYYSTSIVSYSYRPPVTNDNEYYYDIGYYDGYQIGLQEGLDDNFSIFNSVFSAVDSFLDIELFDGFSISTLLYIGFGLLLVGFIIKVFLGG